MTEQPGTEQQDRAATTSAANAPFDPETIRPDFPILSRAFPDGKPLVYLDNAATSQRPTAVLEAMDRFYRTSNANVHRGLHILSEEATRQYEQARITLSRHIGAPTSDSCIFTRNTTEAINLVANAWGRANLRSGDRIVLTEMEHHSNIVPWQLVAEATGAEVHFAPITPDGRLDLEAFRKLLDGPVRMVAFIHVSNTLGTINPAAEIVAMAHEAGALTLVDGAQAVPHMPVDLAALDADFYAFSGHKMCGPTGAGMLYGRRDLLDAMPPFLGGGEMIERVTKQGSTFADLPNRFEAGTPNIAEAIGMAAAADYLTGIGLDRIRAWEQELVAYAIEQMETLPDIRIFGPRDERAGLVAFNFEGLHPHDLSTFLDQDRVAIRAGHHCTQILHDVLGQSATARASFYCYNTKEEADILVDAIRRTLEFFG
jgi:cysteine desulfurase/selenocysteine lyase